MKPKRWILTRWQDSVIIEPIESIHLLGSSEKVEVMPVDEHYWLIGKATEKLVRGMHAELVVALTLGVGVRYRGELLDPREVMLVYPKDSAPRPVMAKLAEALVVLREVASLNSTANRAAQLITEAMNELGEHRGKDSTETTMEGSTNPT